MVLNFIARNAGRQTVILSPRPDFQSFCIINGQTAVSLGVARVSITELGKTYNMTAVPKTEDTAWPWLAHYPAPMDWHADIPVKPLYALLDDPVAKHPHQPAFNFMGKKST